MKPETQRFANVMDKNVKSAIKNNQTETKCSQWRPTGLMCDTVRAELDSNNGDLGLPYDIAYTDFFR